MVPEMVMVVAASLVSVSGETEEMVGAGAVT